MRKNGFTLSELLVGIVIAAIVVLTIGAIGESSTAAYYRLRTRSNVYNDAQFALDLITGSVHGASSASYSGSCLTVGTNNFYKSGSDLIYGSSCSVCPSTTCTTTSSIIKSATSLTFTPVIKDATGTVSAAGRLVHVDLTVTKSGITYSTSVDALRRLP